MKLSIQARAKINWTLDVVGTLPNGYHDLDMLMQSVTLCDRLTIEDCESVCCAPAQKGAVSFVCEDVEEIMTEEDAAKKKEEREEPCDPDTVVIQATDYVL